MTVANSPYSNLTREATGATPRQRLLATRFTGVKNEQIALVWRYAR